MENQWELKAAKEIDKLLWQAVLKRVPDCPEGLSSGVNHADIAEIIKRNYDLAGKEITEHIRSNKVIEGVLADISNGIDRIAVSFEWQNNNQYKLEKGT